jgi:crotonobetainyl-CoA:carnitine CoA-transferase CaiB-like acyl-CoA transferase
VFLHETKDGWIASMPVQEAEFFGIFRALEQPELVDDPRFGSAAARLEHRDELRALMDEAYPKFTMAQLCERFESQDVPYSRLNTRAEVLSDPQVEAMGALLTYQHPQAGLVRTPRPAAQFEQTPSNVYAHTPALGEHSREVLQELGYLPTDIDQNFSIAFVHFAFIARACVWRGKRAREATHCPHTAGESDEK